MAEDTRNPASEGRKTDPGPFLAKVISHHDKNYMGILEVQLYREVGNDDAAEGQLLQARYLSPFYGVTSVDYVSDAEDTYNNTQKSYGMWMIPPDVGSTVMIIFVEGQGWFWMGCVLDDKMNFMTPGYASTYYNVDESKTTDKERVPVAEYNKIIGAETLDSTTITKPATPQEVVLNDQGLLEDDIRGITSSSARRETPSMVFGISTPGPLDKQAGSKTGAVGKREYRNQNTFVSRLGGSSFVMDDGDDKYLRKTKASDGPPEYARVENQEDDGDPTLLHNELMRFRTRTGHQILMHNTEDLIYIGNARGTTWIELTSDGKIDIFAQDSISVHTKNDLNFYADRDINMEAGRNFNLKVAERHQTEVGMDKITIVNGNVAIQVDGTQDETITGAHTQSFEATWDVTTGEQTNITVGGGFDLKTTGANKLTSIDGNMEINAKNTTISGGDINLNPPSPADVAGPATPATPPEPLPTIDNPTEVEGETITSIMARIPTMEPYPHHENLDGTLFKPDATDREAATAIEIPPAWKQYTTVEDTFVRLATPADPEDDNTGE